MFNSVLRAFFSSSSRVLDDVVLHPPLEFLGFFGFGGVVFFCVFFGVFWL